MLGVKQETIIEVITPITILEELKQIYEKKECMYETATMTKLPTTLVKVKEDDFEKIDKLLDAIQDDDDVQMYIQI